ncbi:MAG: chemotaxis-specific protein-glutamate methyltransferase CheB [Thermoleophilia bacterium]|nr:chemotaxis-specific protein-glutamate methyltransferase CheB [Thermoleophilia bacterium]
MTGPPVRALVCDDSVLMRRIVTDLLTSGGVEVVGTARDGSELVARVEELRPDVVTLDVEMPGVDGIAALRQLMRACPTPVVMLSSLTGTGTRATVQALAAGAVDALQKPPMRVERAAWEAIRDELVDRVRAAAAARVGTPGQATAPAAPPAALAARARSATAPLVVIATSTGGPRALHAVVPQLPSPLGVGVLIVQHMPQGFTRALAERLDQASALTVREAADGDEIRPDTALIAPGGLHLEVAGPGRVRLSDAPPVGALRPRADITLATAATAYGRRVLGVVLTGMGNDAEAGARDVKAAGGRVLTEDESTCVIYGMPRAVEKAGLADAVVPLDVMPLAITEAVARGS